MIRRIFPLLGVLFLLGAQNPNADKDKIKLEGTWAVVSFEMDGKPAPEKTVKEMKLIFQDGKLLIRRGPRTLGSGTYKVGIGQKPFVLDYREGPDIISPYDAGILQIEGDTLKICTTADPGKRPMSFDSKLGWLFVLKREAGPKVVTIAKGISYARDVRPFLTKYCVECHNPKTFKAGLDLETYKGMRDGSDRGQVLLPGKPDESPLVLSPEGKKEPHMPPKKAKRKPTPAEVAVLRAWVAAGAKDDSAAVRVAIPDIKPRLPAKDSVAALAYRSDGQLLAAGRYQTITLLDPSSNMVLKPLVGLPGPVTALIFNRLGTRLIVASGKPGSAGELYFYSVPSAGQQWQMPPPVPAHRDLILDIAISSDGKTLATASYDTTVKLWDAFTGKELRILKEHSDSVYGLSFSSDGKLLASGGADRAVKVSDVATGKLLYTFADPTDWVYAVAWSPNGRRLAAAGVDKSIRVWETGVEKGKVVQSVFAHEGPVTRLIYAKDGKTLYSVGEDRVVKAWDAARMVERKVYARQPEAVLSLAVRPDGKQIALGRYDGSLLLLDEASGEPRFQLSRTGQIMTTVAKTIEKPKPTPPQAKKVTPDFGRRGLPLHLVFTGAHLDHVDSVTANHPGVGAKILAEGKGPTSVHVEVSFPPSTPAGVYQLTLNNAGGKSALLPFIVDPFPLTQEQEPNDSPGRSQAVTLPATVAGTIAKAGDVDFLRFEIKQVPQLGVQVQTPGSKLEPVMQLLDASGKVLAESNDGVLGYTFKEVGTYVLGIRDRDFRGGPGMSYRLHLGEIPIITSVYPLGLQRGTQGEILLGGVYLGTTKAVLVKAPNDATPGTRLPITVNTPFGTALGSKSVIVGEYPESRSRRELDRLPPGPALTVQGFLETPGTVSGMLARVGQRDSWRFGAKKGRRLIVEVEAGRLGTSLDSFIEILDEKDQPVPRATLRSLAKTYVTFRDHDSAGPGIRIETWDELRVNDYILVGSELLRIFDLPPNPDADCVFFSERGQRKGYLDTTPTHHAMNTPMYKVEIHPPGTVFPPNGFPVTTLYYRNDDGGPGYGRDSRLTFDPPADGTYRVSIRDSRGQGGADYGYRLTIRPPRPSFNVSFNPTALALAKGSALPISVSAERIDGYDGEINLRLENVPPGLLAPETTIPAGENSTVFALYADPKAVMPGMTKPLKLIARARIDGKDVIREASGGIPKLIDPGDLVTTTNEAEVTVKPGARTYLTVNIERRGFKGRVPLDVRGLPHGVRVLDIGLNGILINENESRRTIVIEADAWVRPTTHPFVVLSRSERKNTEHAARSVLLRVLP